MDEVFAPGFVVVAPGFVMLALNLAGATMVVGLITAIGALVARRASLSFQYGMVRLPLLITLASPALIWLASQWNLGFLPILVSEGESAQSEEEVPPEGGIYFERPAVESASPSSDVDIPWRASTARSSMTISFDEKGGDAEAIDNPAPGTIGNPRINTVDLGHSLLSTPENHSREAVTLSFIVRMFLLVWASGAVWLLGRIVYGLIVIGRLRRSLRRATDPRLVTAVEQLSTRSGMEVRVCESALPAGPLTLSWWRPMIVIPVGLPEVLNDDQLLAILAHELAHARRRDTRFALIQQLVLGILWWNPFLRLISRQASRLREQLCDDFATRLLGDGAPLAEALVRVAQWSNARTAVVPMSINLLQFRSDLEERIRSLTEPSRRISNGLSWRSSGALGAFGLILSLLMLLPILRADEGEIFGDSFDFVVGPSLQEKPAGESTSDRIAGKREFHLGTPAKISVSGHVRTMNQQPIAGATVYLLSGYGDGPRHRAENPLAVTTTNSEGLYEFKDAPVPTLKSGQPNALLGDTGSFQVAAELTGYGIGWRESQCCRPIPRASDPWFHDATDTCFQGESIEFDITLRPERSLTGRIVDEQGKPVENASIDICELDHLDYRDPEGRILSDHQRDLSLLHLMPERYHTAQTDSDGHFEIQGLPPETVARIVIEHPDFAHRSLYAAISDGNATEHRYASTLVTNLTSDGKVKSTYPIVKSRPVSTSPLEIRLPAARRVLVSVVHHLDGTPVEGVRVSATSEGQFSHMSSEKTDEDGHAKLRLPPGVYLVHLFPPDSSDDLRMTHRVVIEDQPAEQNLQLPLKTGCRLTLEAIDAATGRGIPGVTFNEMPSAGLPRSSHFITGEDGNCHAIVAPGTHRYGIETAEGYPDLDPLGPRGRKDVECEAGKTAKLRFRLRK